MPVFEEPEPKKLLTGVTYSISGPEEIQDGLKLYLNYCTLCHGMPGATEGGILPNLGYSRPEVIQNLQTYVLEGPLTSRGMPNFKGRLGIEDVEKSKRIFRLLLMSINDLIMAI